MASLSPARRLGDLPPPHRTFQGHATYIIEWSMMLRPNDSWGTCIPQGIATFLHYASRRGAGYRYTTAPSGIGKMLRRRVVCRYVTCGILLTHREGSASGLIPTARMREREAVLCG